MSYKSSPSSGSGLAIHVPQAYTAFALAANQFPLEAWIWVSPHVHTCVYMYVWCTYTLVHMCLCVCLLHWCWGVHVYVYLNYSPVLPREGGHHRLWGLCAVCRVGVETESILSVAQQVSHEPPGLLWAEPST